MSTPVPATSLDHAATYETVQSRAIAVEIGGQHLVSVRGEDAITFLDGLATQDIAGIPVGASKHALFLTVKARIIAATVAYRHGESAVALQVLPHAAEALQAHFRRHKLRAKIEIEHGTHTLVALVGGAAGDSLPTEVGWFDSPLFGLPARVSIKGERAALPEAAVRGSATALSAVRIERRVPWLRDMPGDYMPAEVGAMEWAVSLQKGCYLGQEPVARLHYRGRANRRLVPVTLSRLPHEARGQAPHELVAAGAPDRTVGLLTSWATSPEQGFVGFAIVRREFEAGAQLHDAAADIEVTLSAV